jgi:hypothetical protein
MLDDLMLWQDEPIISTPAGRLEIEPGNEIRISGDQGSWIISIAKDEITAGDLLYYGVRRDGQKLFVGGAEVTVALTVDFALRETAKIPLLRSRTLQDWDPGGLKKMYGEQLRDGRLLIVFESGVFLLDQKWDLVWHQMLAWVHMGVNFKSIDDEEQVAWLTSDWGDIGYRLADGTVMDPDGLYAWRADQENQGALSRILRNE